MLTSFKENHRQKTTYLWDDLKNNMRVDVENLTFVRRIACFVHSRALYIGWSKELGRAESSKQFGNTRKRYSCSKFLCHCCTFKTAHLKGILTFY